MKSVFRLFVLVFVVAGSLLAINACAGDPEFVIPLDADGNPDAVLATGAEIWTARCATCHGRTGNGGTGPRLADGRVTEKYPEFSVQTSIITNGVGGRMPSFAEKLSAEEIDAVARFTREVL